MARSPNGQVDLPEMAEMTHNTTLLLALTLLFGGIVPATAGTITTRIEDFTNGGGFFAEVRVSDLGPDRIRLTLDVSDPVNPGLAQADLLALWFDLADPGLLPSFTRLDTSGATASLADDPSQVFPSGGVLDAWFDADAIGSLGGNNNLNGGGGVATGFDIGLLLGLNGGRDGFQQQRTFDLVLPGLSSAALTDQRIGLRVQSIAGGAFDGIGSSKLLGELTDTTPPLIATSFATFAAPSGSIPTPAPWVLIGLGLAALTPWSRRRTG